MTAAHAACKLIPVGLTDACNSCKYCSNGHIMTRIYRPYPVAIPPHGCYTAIVANAAVRHSLDSLSVLVMPIHFVIRRQWYRSDAQPCRLSSLSRRCKSCSGKCASGRGMHIDSLHGSLQCLLTFDMAASCIVSSIPRIHDSNRYGGCLSLHGTAVAALSETARRCAYLCLWCIY